MDMLDVSAQILDGGVSAFVKVPVRMVHIPQRAQPVLIHQVRSYVGDGLIYIPPETATRKAWGSKSGTKKLLEARNLEIRRGFAKDIVEEEWYK